jgi:hypothetical protein
VGRLVHRRFFSLPTKALLALSLCFFAQAAAHARTRCEDLASLALDHARVISALEVGPSDIPARTDRLAAHAEAHCEVKGVSTPTSDSQIHFELWLPPADKWNGKYLQKGSGGWGGDVYSYALITPLNRGYATAVTDDGHTGDGTARFTVGHPEKIIDFGYRAIHETSRQSRVILDAFYGRPQKQSYFVGCSDGGREALMQAQRFPEEFNGIVAGAPAYNWAHQLAGFVWNEKALVIDGKNILPAAKLGLLQAAARKACDANDGVRDGIIDDPRTCAFNPDVLLCKKGDAADCLSREQIDAVKKIYAGPVDPVTGKQIYPGFEPGMEAEASSWKIWLLEGAQANFGNSNFADLVYQGSGWDWRTSNIHRDVALADIREAPYLSALSPDLRAFHAHGGKLLMYQGWGDIAVAPRGTIDYYNRVGERLQHSPEDFLRLFMVPGMGHCWGGPGPGSFGNEEVPSPGLQQDADHDIVMALDRWVTDGVAPERIVATKLPEKMSRPLCMYPRVARYQGSGSVDDEKNFRCVAAPDRHK